MILKKSQRKPATVNDSEVPKKQKNGIIGKIGKRIEPLPNSETMEDEVGEVPESEADSRVRLSADIEHQAYIMLKTYAATVRKPIVNIVQNLIYANCKL